MNASLRERVLKVLTGIAPDIDPSQLDPDVEFRDQTDFDSMDMLNFAAGLQREFGIAMSDVDLRDLASLARCQRYLEARL
jgi:acyl carrier protein